MTGREFDSAVLANHHVVAILPTTEDTAWVCSQAWGIARGASTDESRVVLVDLSLNDPMLDAGAIQPTEEGIVDSFLYDVSLNHVAREQHPSSLHYIGVGTPTSDPTAVWSHARWNRLAKGFSNQDALLLLVVPPAAVPHIIVQLDGLIVLGPIEDDSIERLLHANPNWSVEGPPVLGVVERTPVADALPIQNRTVSHPPEHTAEDEPVFFVPGLGRRRWRPSPRHIGVTAAVVVLLAALWAVLRTNHRSLGETVAPAFAATDVAPDSGRAPAGEPIDSGTVQMDSLFYSVQLAAFSDWDRAMAYGAEFERGAVSVAVTPVRVGARVWYRVIFGALPTAASADSVLRDFWRDDLVEDGQGTILRTPQAFDLGSRVSVDSARAESRRLRDSGIPAYIVETSHGTARILVGSFETADQARVAESLLTAAGLPAALTTRTGRTP